MTRPCFIEGDVGVASLEDAEAGFSGTYNPFFSKSRSGSSHSYRSLSSSPSSSLSPRFARLYDARREDHHHSHFLEACFLCKKPLGNNRDIFMYRGDTPFCSEDCRQEQIEIDEAKERKLNVSSSTKAIRKEQQKNSSPNKSRNYQVRTGTVAAA